MSKLSERQISRIHRMANHSRNYYNLPDEEGVYHKFVLAKNIADKVGCTEITVMKYVEPEYRREERKRYRKWMATEAGQRSKKNSNDVQMMMRECALYPRELNLKILEYDKRYYVNYFNKVFGAGIPKKYAKGPRYARLTHDNIKPRDHALENYRRSAFEGIAALEKHVLGNCVPRGRPKKLAEKPASKKKHYSEYVKKYDASPRGKERTATWSFIEASSLLPKHLTLNRLDAARGVMIEFFNDAFDAQIEYDPSQYKQSEYVRKRNAYISRESRDKRLENYSCMKGPSAAGIMFSRFESGAGLPDHIKGPRYNEGTSPAVVSRDYRLDNYVNAKLGVAGLNESLVVRKGSRYNERTSMAVKMRDGRLDNYTYAKFGAAADSERIVLGAGGHE